MCTKYSRRLTRSPVDSNGSLWPSYLRLRIELPLVEESLTCKDKGCLDGRLHSDAKVNIRAKKHQVYKVVSILEIVYLVMVLSTFYIG